MRKTKNLKVFECPNCGKRAVSVIFNSDKTATVKCVSCQISEKVMTNSLTERVDAFGDFMDAYYKKTTGKKIEVSLTPQENNVGTLKKEKSVEEVFGGNSGYLEF